MKSSGLKGVLMNPLLIIVFRFLRLSDRTLGRLIVNGDFWGYSMEPPFGEYAKARKVKGCIPAGLYCVENTLSARFKKRLPLLSDVVGFSGIRIHGGNNPEDTAGCLLVAHDLIDNKLRNSLSGTLVSSLDAHGNKGLVHIVNVFGGPARSRLYDFVGRE
jgi:hypothetical protein